MSVQNWMRADALMSILLDRGYGSEASFAICERAAIFQYEAGLSELDAITEALGFVPSQLRAELERKEK